MDNIPTNAEIVNIGFHKHSVPFDLSVSDNFNDVGDTKVNEYICHLKRSINPCSLAYIVTLKGASKLIECF